MASAQSRAAAANAVRAFLAEIASVYLGKVYDHKRDGWSKKIWGMILEHFDQRCAYCQTKIKDFKKGVFLTQEHLIEINQFQVGLHHPGNTVPACSECNGSRDKNPEGSRLTWQEHLANLAEKKGWTIATMEKRMAFIQAFVDKSGYPILSDREKAYLLETAQALYKDVAARCTAGCRGFVEIHGADAVRIKTPSTSAAQNGHDLTRKIRSRG